MRRAVLALAFGLLAGPAQAFSELEASRGAALFAGGWTPEDGLGPLANARSCADCHPSGGRGDPAGPALVLQLAGDPVYGRQIQPGEATVVRDVGVQEVRLGDGTIVGLQRPVFRARDARQGVVTRPASARLAPSLRGLALLARIPASATTPPRFGLRASEPTLRGQVVRALHLDLGLSSAAHPSAAGDCMPRQPACLAAATVSKQPEVTEAAVDALVSYLEALRPLPTAATEPPELETFGCTACHRRHFKIPSDPSVTGTTSETIAPYTDLRLHDLGPGLADAQGRSWRTAPLWGLRDRRRTLLHDGRARSPEEAILWHGGEAEAAREAYAAAPAQVRAALLNFLMAL